jgi:hypothetical protein
MRLSALRRAIIYISSQTLATTPFGIVGVKLCVGLPQSGISSALSDLRNGRIQNQSLSLHRSGVFLGFGGDWRGKLRGRSFSRALKLRQ